MELQYSFQPGKEHDESRVARAIARDLNVSFKKTAVVCDFLRGRKLDSAINLLEEVAALKRPIPFKKYQRGASHKPGVGMSKYPEKSASYILELLKSVRSNAEYKGLDTEKLKVVNIQANKGPVRKKRRPKGRWRVWRSQYVTVQVVVGEE